MDSKTYMSFDILSKVDIASMMHSLEVRTPLIDKNLWELATTIPEEFLVNNKNGKWEGKLLLKKLMEKNYSDDFIYRKKQGFAVPLSKWFSDENEYKLLIENKLLSPNSLLAKYFNADIIAELVANKHTHAIWMLLFLEEWLTQFNVK